MKEGQTWDEWKLEDHSDEFCTVGEDGKPMSSLFEEDWAHPNDMDNPFEDPVNRLRRACLHMWQPTPALEVTIANPGETAKDLEITEGFLLDPKYFGKIEADVVSPISNKKRRMNSEKMLSSLQTIKEKAKTEALGADFERYSSFKAPPRSMNLQHSGVLPYPRMRNFLGGPDRFAAPFSCPWSGMVEDLLLDEEGNTRKNLMGFQWVDSLDAVLVNCRGQPARAQPEGKSDHPCDTHSTCSSGFCLKKQRAVLGEKNSSKAVAAVSALGSCAACPTSLESTLGTSEGNLLIGLYSDILDRMIEPDGGMYADWTSALFMGAYFQLMSPFCALKQGTFVPWMRRLPTCDWYSPKSNVDGDTSNCRDTDNGLIKDAQNDFCLWYYDFEDKCGQHDTLEFKASELCCACGGGSKAWLPQISLEYGLMFLEDSKDKTKTLPNLSPFPGFNHSKDCSHKTAVNLYFPGTSANLDATQCKEAFPLCKPRVSTYAATATDDWLDLGDVDLEA